MPTPPKLNEIPVYLKDEGRGKVSFVFEDDRSEDFPYDVTLYLKNNDNDTEIAIGTATTLSENVFYFEDEDDKGKKGNYLYDAHRTPIGWVEQVKNSLYIKQSDLVGGAKPPTEHPGQVGINNLDVGNEYEFVIQSPIDTEQRIYRGTLISKTDDTLRITDYTINNGVRQDGIRSFPLVWVRRATILATGWWRKEKEGEENEKGEEIQKSKENAKEINS